MSTRNSARFQRSNTFRPDDYFYVSADELEPAPDGKVIYNSQPASEFKGEGVRVRKVLVEGPLESTWPPQRTRALFPGVEWEPAANGRYYKPVTTKSHYEHIRDAVAALAPRAFRRPVTDKEIEDLTNLAVPSSQSPTRLHRQRSDSVTSDPDFS